MYVKFFGIDSWTPETFTNTGSGPLEISLEMAHYVVCPQKKIISRIFKISGALIVKYRHLTAKIFDWA